MRPACLYTVALAALVFAPTHPRLLAQSPPRTIRKIADIVDTLGSMGLAEPASGRFIVNADARGIHVIDERTGQVTATIGNTIAPVARSYMFGSLSISASGRRLAFLASGDASDVAYVWTVDLDTVTGKPVSEPHRVSILPAGGLSISDDGRWIAFTSSEAPHAGERSMRKLITMPSDGGEERILDTAANIQTPRWSPDGKTIYYIRGRGHGPGLARITAAGGQPDSLAPGMSVIGVSADGQRVAYLPLNGDNRMMVRVVDPHGREVATLLAGLNDYFMTWSRHEPGAMLSRRGEWPATLKTVALDNGSVSSFPLTDRWASGARFSPDGRRLAMMSVVDDREQIIIYDTASKQRRVLRTTVEPINWAPDGPAMQWSPDGLHIAFLALDSTFLRHDLYIVDVATSRSVRVADLGPHSWGNAVLFRWRSDGQSIDYINRAARPGAPATLERVTLGGNHSVITRLPVVPHGGGPDGGYRLLNDSLLAIGRNPRTDTDSAYLAIVDARTGVTRAVINKGAYWQLSDNSSVVSPDGKWLAFGSRRQKDNQAYELAITSLDGKTVRVLGEPLAKPCSGASFYGQASPHQWLPDSKSLIALAGTCGAGRPQVYVVPIDGTAARHVPVPGDWDPDVAVMPDGRSVLVTSIQGGSMGIFAVDLTPALGARALQSGKPRKSGRN